ncbi:MULTISPECIES: hypothetical protein [Salinivibrio]|uniref:hypothetical protein n=1 Tax=Salinivibrio TaxID=51366 RepID=UPI000614645C|nr:MULTISPECIES: hypothetical protein [Salinivibrio]KKA44108.1 hypothetical protein WN56_12870 [Salinivibrio sp. KP-1]OOE62347.1 hypothetical protein BZG18_05235 [Salinivibrio kushneri]
MNTPRIILHLGLPKTATTSIQHNVFQKLHEEKRINFLGKCLDFDYKSANLNVINYAGKFIRDAAEQALSISEARRQLAISLDNDLLNVFSDEGLMIAYPGKENLPLKRKFNNLKAIFEGYDVQVVVTTREPVDYLYSLYVQLYPDYFDRIDSMNSFGKYISRLLAEPDNVLFESFFYSKWLKKLQSQFDVTVLDYEDFAKNKPNIYQSWSDLLLLSEEEFQSKFEANKINEKKKVGKEVKEVKSFKYIEDKVRIFLRNRGLLFLLFKWIYNQFGLKRALRYRYSSRGLHHYPTKEQCDRLRELHRHHQY